MKIRVTKEERLSKAVNRANLVLVEVPVNTKYGQHRSHRWKKAGEALNQLMKDLGRKGNSADIEFVDKKTKKKIGKKELLENYNKVGKVKGQTIQAYVAENYKVTSGGKAGAKTNDYNGPDDKKDPLSRKDKMVTMYAKNKYKRQTYTGIGKCGHEVSVEVGGYSEEYRQDMANNEISERMCPECYKKMIEEKRKAAEKEAGNMGLPELEGTPKQINWALSIRSDAIKELTPVIDYAQELLGKNPQNEVAKKFFYAAQDLIQMTSASDWIDRRNGSFIRMVRNQIEPDLMDDMPPLDDAAANDARNRVIGIYNDDVKAYADLIDNKFRNIEDYRQRKDHGRFNRITEEDFQDIVNKRFKDLNERGEGKYMPEIQGVHEILMNKTNPYMWNATRKNHHAGQIIAIFKYDGELTMPKIGSEEDKEGLQAAYDVRADIARDLRVEKERIKVERGKYTAKDLKRVEQVLESLKDGRFYKELAGIDIVYKYGACIELSKKWERQAEALNEIFENGDEEEFNYSLLKRFGTKEIKANGEFEKAKDFASLKKSLAELKDQHTDVVARACMDMAGISSPLYVKRNGNLLRLGQNSVFGYCQYGLHGDVHEIGVVDHPNNRMHSYKTTIHEVMHGLLAQTRKDGDSIGVSLPKAFNEGIVELVGYTGTKEAYQKEYRTSDVRSYKAFVMETFMRLRSMPEYRGLSLSKMGKVLGEAAFNRDYETLNKINNFLKDDRLKKPELHECLDSIQGDINRKEADLDGVARRRYEGSKEVSPDNYEKTKVAKLVELLKSGAMTMQQALASGQFMDAAIVLIYNILDEEDDEELGLF